MEPYERKVNYYETDKMGIVHHSNYLRWFEEARVYCMDQFGMGYDQLEERGISIPMLELNCKYRLPLRFGDRCFIHARITEYNGIRMTVKYRITDESGDTLYTQGETRHCFTDREGKPVYLKKSAPDFHEMFLKHVEEDWET